MALDSLIDEGQLKRALSECTGDGVARLGRHLRSPPGHLDELARRIEQDEAYEG